jgi:hypothetical protein
MAKSRPGNRINPRLTTKKYVPICGKNFWNLMKTPPETHCKATYFPREKSSMAAKSINFFLTISCQNKR